MFIPKINFKHLDGGYYFSLDVSLSFSLVNISQNFPVIVPCPHGSPENRICYRNGTSANGQLTTCNKECLGGCSGPTQDDCHACQNARLIGSRGGCRNQCPEPSLLVRLLKLNLPQVWIILSKTRFLKLDLRKAWITLVKRP